MKSVSTAMQAHISGIGKTLARCWQVTTLLGDIKGFTNHTRNITVEGVTYLTAQGLLSTSVASSEGLDVDNIDVSAFLDATTEADLEAGKFDNALVSIFDVNYLDTSMGTIPIKKGRLGEISRKDGRFIAEIRGLSQTLFRKLGRVHLNTCDARLGDSRCQVDLVNRKFVQDWVFTASTKLISVTNVNPSLIGFLSNRKITVTGSVSNDGTYTITAVGSTGFIVLETLVDETGSDVVIIQLSNFAFSKTISAVDSSAPKRIVTLNNITDHFGATLPEDFFQEGTITFTNGPNLGIGRDIRVQNGPILTCYQEFPFTITPSETVVAESGCNLTKDICINKFANMRNFRGFPDIPTPEEIFDSPIVV